MPSFDLYGDYIAKYSTRLLNVISLRHSKPDFDAILSVLPIAL